MKSIPMKSVRKKIQYILMFSDVFSLILSFFVGAGIGFLINNIFLNSSYEILTDIEVVFQRAAVFGVLSVAVVVWVASATRYDRGGDSWKHFVAVFRAVMFAFVLDVILQYLTKQSFSRLWLIGSWFSALIVIPIFHHLVIAWLASKGLWRRKVIVLQSQSVELPTADLLKREWPRRYEVLAQRSIDWGAEEGQLRSLLSAHPKGDILFVFATELSEITRLEHMCRVLERYGADFFILPELGVAARRGLYQEVTFEHGIPVIHGSNRLLKQSTQRSKRIMDICLSLIGLAAFALPMLLLAIWIKKDGGSAIYGHSRVGYKGREFKCLKFRSMAVNSDELLRTMLESDPAASAEWNRDFKLKNDPRVTGIGHFIRKTSIDELPQLLNVLKGEMSLVGPRPVIRQELDDYYGNEAEIYTSVIPGITGLWQVSGRNDTTYEKRIDLDVRYARSWSIFLDIKILIKTPFVVFARDGAY